MIHLFPEPAYELMKKEMTELSEGPDCFTDPFRYAPHPLVKVAARHTMDMIAADHELSAQLSQGKMLGVLVVRDNDGKTGYISGFSGLVGGRSTIEGFVPPIFDLDDPKGRYRTEEAEISGLNEKIRALTTGRMASVQEDLHSLMLDMQSETSRLRDRKSFLHKDDPEYIRQSQFINAEIKRVKDRWKGIIAKKEEELAEIRREIDTLRKCRAEMSDGLQKWIFRQYIVHNAKGESHSIYEIFARQGLMPPGGTGDCAAPKLLEHAYRNGLKPLAMGEFWYGLSPETAVRTHGHFYPSCTSKCGPLLSFMTSGLEGMRAKGTCLPPDRECLRQQAGVSGAHILPDQIRIATGIPEVIYEDEWIAAVEKPTGMPSVPGLDGKISLQERMKEILNTEIHSVHRLDMDTSGIIIYAKTPEAAADLRKQFEEHTVRKTYMARLSPADPERSGKMPSELKAGDKGRIELALCPDYDERPRQKADKVQGKPSLTDYEVISVNDDGTTDIIFHPITGRTHQLRVHSAHILGLGRPILGDLLYGGHSIHEAVSVSAVSRLHLHALSITFTHPVHGSEMTFTSASLAY